VLVDAPLQRGVRVCVECSYLAPSPATKMEARMTEAKRTPGKVSRKGISVNRFWAVQPNRVQSEWCFAELGGQRFERARERIDCKRSLVTCRFERMLNGMRGVCREGCAVSSHYLLQRQCAGDRDSYCSTEEDGCYDHRERLVDEDAQQLGTRKERRQRHVGIRLVSF
jgi:hypothetical protein